MLNTTCNINGGNIDNESIQNHLEREKQQSHLKS